MPFTPQNKTCLVSQATKAVGTRMHHLSQLTLQDRHPIVIEIRPLPCSSIPSAKHCSGLRFLFRGLELCGQRGKR